MKLKKISKDHYVLTDDSEIKEGDWFLSKENIIHNNYGWNYGDKKITRSTQPIEDLNGALGWKDVDILLLSEVKELLGEVDVEKMAEEALISHPDFKAEGYSDYQNGRFNGIVEGYNQALEDNKEKKYTEDDMIEWAMCMIAQYVHGNTNIWNKDLLRESLPQPKTEWEVEFVDGKLKLV